ncbi:MAG: hypothetical protein IJJ33_11945, partial [Victivallales bacterium]|nr:hypothetical protein [Victivallales bacterium]
MVRGSLILLLVLSLAAFSAPMLTSFGALGERELGGYGLMVKQFRFDHGLARAECLRVCEALDGSSCLLLNDSGDALNYLFAEATICAAVTRLLERGGLVFFNVPNWSWMRKRPLLVYRYFQEIDAPLPVDYHAFPSRNMLEFCEVAEEFVGQWPASPEKEFPILAGGHAGRSYDGRWRELWRSSIDKRSVTGLFRDDVKGKGVVLVNYASRMLWAPLSPFFLNMVRRFYGESVLPKQSVTRTHRRRDGEEMDVHWCDIRRPQVFHLVLIASGEPSPCPTEVHLTPDEHFFKCRFVCHTPKPDELKTNIAMHDGALWLDDCVEVFIQGGLRNSDPMYHFIVNSKGILYDAKDSATAWECEGVKVSGKVTPQGYEVELAIPFASLGLAGRPFRANFCREVRSGVPLSPGEKLKYEQQLQALRRMTSFGDTGSYNYFGTEPFPEGPQPRASRQSTDGVRVHKVPAFTKIYADYAPQEGEGEVEALQFTVARNDKELAILALVNGSDANLRYRVEIDRTLDRRKERAEQLFTMKEVLPYRAVNRQVFWEIITPLNQAAVIAVPGNDLGVLSVEVKTQLPPGKYRGGFTLVPVNADVPKRHVSVQVEVLNLELPDKLPFEVYLFGPYTGGRRYWTQWGEETAPLFWQYVDFCKSYHAWTVHSRDPLNQAVVIKDKTVRVSSRREDYLLDEKELQAAGLKWSYHYGVWAVLHARLKKAGLAHTLKDEATRGYFEEAIRNWSRFAKEEGIDFSRFWVPVWDEPRSDVIEEVILAAD